MMLHSVGVFYCMCLQFLSGVSYNQTKEVSFSLSPEQGDCLILGQVRSNNLSCFGLRIQELLSEDMPQGRGLMWAMVSSGAWFKDKGWGTEESSVTTQKVPRVITDTAC